jgi:hypothetical protein
MFFLRKILAPLGTTPKDRLSSLAACLVFLGGTITTLAAQSLLPDRWVAIGMAASTIGSSAIGLLTGRDSYKIGQSDQK